MGKGKSVRQKRAGSLLAAQNRALDAVAGAVSLEKALSALTDLVEEQARHTVVAAIMLASDDNSCLTSCIGPGLPQWYRDALKNFAIKKGVGTCAHAAAINETVITTNIETAESWRGLAHMPLSLGLKAAWSMPIAGSDGRVLGTFGTYFRECRKPKRRERQIVEGLCRTAALVIERRHSDRMLRGNQVRQALLLDLMQGRRATPDPNVMMTAAAEAVGRYLGANRVGFFDIVADDALKFTASWTDGVLGPLEDTFPAKGIGTRYLEEVRAGRTLGIADTENDPLTADSMFDRIGVRAIIGAPIIRDGRWHAGMYVNHALVRDWKEYEVALVREVAEQTWDAVERAHAVEALRAADQHKDEFLAILGHELRNPLAPLCTGLDLLKAAQKNPEIAEKTRSMMQRQLGHLVRLVDDLLDISRISRGKVELQRTSLDLLDVVQSATELCEPIIRERRHELIVEHADPALPVEGDYQRLTQVIGNLLSNAAKYTEPGGTVRIQTGLQEEHALVRVTDTGVGIPGNRIEALFEMFSQVAEHRERMGGGLGIGLALARQLIEMHGGSIRASSDGAGCGSQFELRLPVAACAVQRSWRVPLNAQISPRQASSSSAFGHGAKTGRTPSSGDSGIVAGDGYLSRR